VGILWEMGTDDAGYHWLACYGDGAAMPSIYWRDGDPPERFRYLAEQAADMAKQEAEQIRRWTMQERSHRLQAEAYQAIAEALATGQPFEVIIKGLEDDPAMQRGDPAMQRGDPAMQRGNSARLPSTKGREEGAEPPKG